MLFFFSSRRRHTRLQGDWSSDVCSSDLPCAQRCTSSAEHASPAETSVFSDRHSASGKRESTDGGNVTMLIAQRSISCISSRDGTSTRSEERRVGKGGRGRWWP